MLVSALLAGPAEARWQVFTSAANALASNVVVTISEARDGALWIGTPQGLNRFDGARWQTWRDSLPGPSVSCVLRDRAGHVWVGTDGGVTRWDGQAWWRPDATDPDQPRGQAQAVIEDHAGELWIGTTLGLFRYQPTSAHWTAIPTAMLRDRNVSQLFEDSRRRIWVGSPRGALVVDSTRALFTPLDRDPAKPDSLAALGEDGSGGIWFGTPLGAFRWDGSAWSGYATAQGLPSDTVYAFATDRHGRIWIGTADGIARFDGRTFHRELETAPSQRIGTVLSLIVDRVGNLWVGTARSGMLRSDGVDIHRYYSSGTTACVVPTPVVPFEAVLGSGCRTPMLQDRSGDLWFASRESVLDRFSRDGVTWSQLRPGPSVLLPTAVNTILEDASSSLWFGSRTQGLAILDSTRTSWTTYRIVDGLPSDSIATILEDSAAEIWAGTANGLARRSAGIWSRFLDAGIDGVPVRVVQILEDGGRTLWLRTSAGLWSLDPARQVLTPHGPATGLPDPVITSLAASPAGELWAGSAHGVSRRVGAGWEVRDAAALGDSLVSLIAFDDGGRLWTVLENSVLVRSPVGSWAPPAGFVPFASGGFRPRQVLEDEDGLHWFASASGLGSWAGEAWRFFGTAAGLATTQADRLLEDSQGRLWASSFGGITRWEPDHVAPRSVILSDQPRVVALRSASITYGAGYGDSDDLEFDAWWDTEPMGGWSSTTTSSRSALGDGMHVFHVRARDRWHNTDPLPDTVSFVVDATPPQAILSSPSFGGRVQGVAAIVGSTTDDRYVRHRIEYRAPGATTWTLIDSAHVSVDRDTLSHWDTRGLADGRYELRLSVDDQFGLVGVALEEVVVDNVEPFEVVTSPVELTAAKGGHVYTTNAEVHAYFPPLGFDADPIVTIDSDPAGVPAEHPDGATPVDAGWRVAWSRARMVHPGVLEMRAPSGASEPLAIYREAGSGTWERLGGRAASAGSPLAVPLDEAGRYALFAGGSPAGTGGLGAITLVPRAFSPSGAFGSRDIAIGFSLGRPGTVSVKVFNRAGRLVRVVSDGLGVPAGSTVVRWDGRDHGGRTAEEGLYFVTVEALGETRTRALAVVR